MDRPGRKSSDTAGLLRQAAGQQLDRWRAAAGLPGQQPVTSAIDTVSGPA